MNGTNPTQATVTTTYSSLWPAFNLRMPDDLKRYLAASANENGRSLNSEIIQRLLKSRDGYRKL